MHSTTKPGRDPSAILPETARALLRQHWTPRMGAIDAHDLAFIAACIDTVEATKVVEVGCASGLSTACIARVLEARGGGSIDSFDASRTFYADRTKKVGYIARDLPALTDTTVTIHAPAMSLRLSRQYEPRSIDLVFVDASHNHPWPALDTLCALPLVKDGGIIIHHDVLNYKSATNALDVGPKLLHDQISREHLIAWSDMATEEMAGDAPVRRYVGNIFGLHVKDRSALAREVSESLYFPWTTDEGLPPGQVSRLGAIIGSHYDETVMRALEVTVDRYVLDKWQAER